MPTHMVLEADHPESNCHRLFFTISKSILTFANISNGQKMHALFMINTDNLKNKQTDMQYNLCSEYIPSITRGGVKSRLSVLSSPLWKIAAEHRQTKCGENISFR